MDTLKPIYTEVNDCRDCYKCVRWCPVKAIKVEKDSASIIPELCIFCGRCTQICPSKAKKVRNDLKKTQYLTDTYEHVIASLAPSYVSEFDGISPGQMIAALKKLGFFKVSETALGAELVSKKCYELIQTSNHNIHISTACPVVVQLVNKYYPQMAENLTPVMSPLQAHSKMLKEKKWIETKVVFIGPCIAKKTESDEHPEWVDVVITFQDLKNWFEEMEIDPRTLTTDDSDVFFPEKAQSASLYPIDGGMINSINQQSHVVDYRFLSYSGIGNIKRALNGLMDYSPKKPIFLEFLACESGCINGPCTISQQSVAVKRLQIIDSFDETGEAPTNPEVDIVLNQISTEKTKPVLYKESDITDALQVIGKNTKADELNCGGCGYDSCRDFARAMIHGKAEQNMCVSYMKRIAQNKATSLIQKMPSGVIMVDEHLKVIEVNRSFARMMGAEMENIYEINPGLSGADVRKLVSFHKLFLSVLQSGEDYLEKDIRENGKLFHVSIFSIQKHRIVCGLFRDMFAPEVQKDEVIERTRKVIKENLATVQQIAFLLGENASKTEAILNSIVESYKGAGIDE